MVHTDIALPPSSMHHRLGAMLLFVFVVLLATGAPANAFPDQGKWDFVMNRAVHEVTVPKSMFAGSKIYVQITCESTPPDTGGGDVYISWILTQSLCWSEHSALAYENSIPTTNNQQTVAGGGGVSELLAPRGKLFQIEMPRVQKECRHGGHIILDELLVSEPRPASSDAAAKAPAPPSADQKAPQPETAAEPHGLRRRRRDVGNRNAEQPVFTITKDGDYHFTFIMQPVDGGQLGDFEATVHIEMRSSYGNLSAVDYPLLIFYGAMCIVYLIFGLIWLLVSFMQWRDLLRIQFWIGAVILLGMLEKAMFYAEYQSINSTGVSVNGIVLLAEWVSCAKRTLARMLVVIVSLGFGIVKPRLGPMLHRVVGTGGLYFVLACVESYLRLKNTQNDPSNKILVASIPLAVLDSAICWWIFTSLVQTTRTLRLRRNAVKLQLYRHFTNTLIFGVLASVVFMLYSIKTHKVAYCLKDWKALWQDEAFWHLLFSALLLVIMILWRPTNNNQRYAFTPLLDNPEDEDDDDDEEDQFVADAYGVKLRGQSRSNLLPKSGGGGGQGGSNSKQQPTTNEEDDLRWVEENIPQSIADVVLPVLDSDEEIISTKFEVSKMQ